MWQSGRRRRWIVIAGALLALAVFALLDARFPAAGFVYAEIFPLVMLVPVTSIRVALVFAVLFAIAAALVEAGPVKSGGLALLGRGATYVIGFSAVVWLFGRTRSDAARLARRRTSAKVAEDFRQTVEAIPTIAWTADAHGRLDYLNAHFLEFTGASAADVADGAWLTFIHPADADREVWRRQAERGEQYAVQFRVRGRDGTYRWFFGRSTPLKDPSGHVVRWVGAAINVDAVKAQEAREGFLAEAGGLLSGSVGARETLENLARAPIPYLADWCTVELFESDGTLQVRATAHRTAEGAETLQHLAATWRQHRSQNLTSAAVARSGAPLLIDANESWGPRSVVLDARAGRLVRRLERRCSLAAPLRARGKMLGVVTFHSSDPERTYSDDDVAAAQEFCRRAALAYDNALLYENEHLALERATRLTDTLQKAFLPSNLPAGESFRFDAVYLPADDQSRVGGDWYDAVLLRDGTVAFSIGDVTGNGLGAALAMTRVRQTIVALLLEGHDPGEVLEKTNRVLIRSAMPYATCVAGFFDPQAGTIRFSTAGHPPPVVGRADGAPQLLPYGGPPLGIEEQMRYASSIFPMSEGSLAVFYTDGLLEFDHDLIANERRLLEVVAALAPEPGPHPAIAVQRHLMGPEPHRDDVAVLVISVERAAVGQRSDAP